jgi:hypothetical protein
VLEARVRDDSVELSSEPLEGRVDDGSVPGGRRQVAVGDVDAVHLPAVVLQPVGDRGADAARGTGHEHVPQPA